MEGTSASGSAVPAAVLTCVVVAACSVYGGPGVQRVRDVYNTTRNPRPQRFRDMGFLVFQVDNRGSSRRGVAFEAPLKHKMGTVEVDDQVRLQRCGDATRLCLLAHPYASPQVDGVRYLVAKGLADPARVGIYGWSYGGYDGPRWA